MEFSQVNHLAVGLWTVLALALGMLGTLAWLFANAWMSEHGYTEKDVERMQSGMMPTSR